MPLFANEPYSMSRLTLTPLDYSADLISCYESLRDLPDFVLLESSDKLRGRYDIVSAMSYDSLLIRRNTSNIQDAFQRFERMLPTTTSSCDLPFQGGAIGYIAYDIGEIQAGIHSTPHPCNDMPLIDMRFYDWAIVVDHELKRVTLVAANTKTETASTIREVMARWGKHHRLTSSFVLQQAFTPLVSKNEYRQAFHAIHQELVRGRSYQVNYTQPFLGRYEGSSWEMYKRVRAKNPVPFSAFLHCIDGDILSFSPERFLMMDNGHVLTSPIKGTSKRSETPELDEKLRASLASSSKNKAENVMIVDLLRNDLGKIAKPGSVKVTALCEVQSFSAVHHLVSNIEAKCLPNLTSMQVFVACFPGGSITGAPKREAMRIIHEHELYARGVYCGSIAYFSAHGRFDSNLCIRTLTAKRDTLYLSAGGGLVIDSNWEDEYLECFTKIAGIVKHLQD
jgi:para-aminobenzoate synthetase component 1